MIFCLCYYKSMVGFSKGGGEEQQSQSQARIAATIKEQVKNIVSQLESVLKIAVEKDLTKNPYLQILSKFKKSIAPTLEIDLDHLWESIHEYYDTVLQIEDKVFTLVDEMDKLKSKAEELNKSENEDPGVLRYRAVVKERELHKLEREDPAVHQILAEALESLKERTGHYYQNFVFTPTMKQLLHNLANYFIQYFQIYVIDESARITKERVEALRRIAEEPLRRRADAAAARRNRPVVQDMGFHDQISKYNSALLGGGRYHKKKSKRKSMRKFKSKRLSKKKPIRKIKSKRLSKKKPIRKIKSKRSKKT